MKLADKQIAETELKEQGPTLLEVSNWLISQDNGPLPLLGFQLKAELEGDEFDITKFEKYIKKLGLSPDKLNSSNKIIRLTYNDLRKKKEKVVMVDDIPEKYKVFLLAYYKEQEVKIKEKTTKILRDPEINTILKLIQQIVRNKDVQSTRPLSELEKHIFMQPMVESVQHETPKSPSHSTVYAKARRLAEMQTVMEKESQQLSDQEIDTLFLDVLKNTYLKVKSLEDPHFNPVNTHFHLNKDEVLDFLRTFDGKKLKKKDQLIFNITNSLIFLVSLSFSHTDPLFLKKNLSTVEYIMLDNLNLYEESDFGSLLLDSIRMRSQLLSESKLDFLSTSENKTDDENEKNKNSLATASIFSGLEAVSKRLSSLKEYIANSSDTLVRISGYPHILARFPNQVSLFPEDIAKESSYNFVDYSGFSEEKDFTTRVTAVSKKLFYPREDQSSKYRYLRQYVYLALPQYAPIANISVSFNQELSVQQPVQGIDFNLEYEEKTGHYRIKFLNEKSINLAKFGIKYEVGLDFVKKQEHIPQKAEQLPLNSLKVFEVSTMLEEIGFSKLAKELKKSLRPNFTDKIKSLFLGNNLPEYTTKNLEKALLNSIYYEFGDTLPKLAEATQVVADFVVEQGLLNKDSFHFLTLPAVEGDKIPVQCGQIAELYATLLQYVLQSEDQTILSAHSSSLFTDTANGITALFGFKSFRGPHADTQLLLTDSEEVTRFQKDLTPQIGLLKALKLWYVKTHEFLKNLSQAYARGAKGKNKNSDNQKSSSESMQLQQELGFIATVVQDSSRFNSYILELKKILIQSTNPADRWRTTDAKSFVYGEVGMYHKPDKLEQLARKKPLATVINMVLFFQDKSIAVFQSQESVSQIESALHIVQELFAEQMNRQKNTRERFISPLYSKYTEELSRAAVVAKKLLDLIEAHKYVVKLQNE